MAAASLTLALVLAGCSSGPSLSMDGGVLTTSEGLHVLYGPDESGGPQARVEGLLTRVGSCLGLAQAGERMFAVVWPYGTRVVRASPFLVHVPGYGTYAFGADVALSGAGDTAPTRLGHDVVPTSCRRSGVWDAD